MTDELKDQFRHLVADPPPPTGVPSEAVFARIRTARRRRTAGVAAGAAAAVVAVVAVATSTFAGPNSAPPITNTPGRPQTIVTGPPTITPSETSPSSKSTVTKPLAPTNKSDSPPPSSPSSPDDTSPPAPLPVKVNLSLTPTVKGMTATVKYQWSGSLLVPISTISGKSLPTAGYKFSDLAFNWDYDFGDGRYDPPTGKLGSGLTCDGAHDRVSGNTSDVTQTHTYEKAGTYTFSYLITYCTPEGEKVITKTEKLVIKAPSTPTSPTSPSP
jgi:hypothetical protein